MDRQPSWPSCSSSSGKLSTGFTRCPTTSSTSKTNTRRPTPICGAARPAPAASSNVSVRSATSVRSSLSKSTTGSAGERSTGSPNRRIGVTDTEHSSLGSTDRCGGLPRVISSLRARDSAQPSGTKPARPNRGKCYGFSRRPRPDGATPRCAAWGDAMSFIQLIEYETDKPEAMQALSDEMEDAGMPTRITRMAATKNLDTPNGYVTIVEFPSYEEAMENSN